MVREIDFVELAMSHLLLLKYGASAVVKEHQANLGGIHLIILGDFSI